MGQYLYVEEEGIRYPTFVDDTMGAGSVQMIKEMNIKMKTLERTKKFKYNNAKGKTEWMLIQNRKRKNEGSEIELEVKAGKIGKTTEYKYLGDKYNEKGSNISKIEHKGKEIEGMVRDIIRESTSKIIGSSSLQVRLMLMNVIATPTLLSNTETWFNINKTEEKMITIQHHKVLTRCLQLPRSTPYYGIISEMNILPYVDIIWYRKFMWLYRLVNSDDERLAKRILKKQEQEENNWYTEIKTFAQKNSINIQYHQIQEITYNEYKEHIKTQIKHKIYRELNNKKQEMTKLRFIKPGKQQEYLKSEQTTLKQAQTIMKIRLNMIATKSNYKNDEEDTTCRRCGQVEETTEHVLECYTGTTFDKNKIDDTKWLKTVAPMYEGIHDINRPEQNDEK